MPTFGTMPSHRESQANDSIIRDIAGHVSPRVLALYSHRPHGN